jgi:pyruvate/oxaloacetate carboxyltransferase
MNARNRFKEALDQRLSDKPSPTETHTVYNEAIEELLKIAIDSVEIDDVSRQFASNPDAIDFPE